MLIEETPNGFEYTWDLAGPDGAAYLIFPPKDYTREDMKEAKHFLKDNFDVVSLRVATEEDWDYRYKSEIFAHPDTRPLSWEQIYCPDELIRKERKAGTSVDDFVKTHVLPRIS